MSSLSCSRFHGVRRGSPHPCSPRLSLQGCHAHPLLQPLHQSAKLAHILALCSGQWLPCMPKGLCEPLSAMGVGHALIISSTGQSGLETRLHGHSPPSLSSDSLLLPVFTLSRMCVHVSKHSRAHPIQPLWFVRWKKQTKII